MKQGREMKNIYSENQMFLIFLSDGIKKESSFKIFYTNKYTRDHCCLFLLYLDI